MKKRKYEMKLNPRERKGREWTEECKSGGRMEMIQHAVFSMRLTCV